MRIALSIILSTLNVGICISQSKCELAEKRAIIDFNNNSFALHSSEVLPVNNTYFHVLREYYGVNWYFTDSLEFYNCYDSVMIQHLNKKFNHDFITKAHELADSLENTDNWIKDPQFQHGKMDFYKYVLTRINLKGMKKYDFTGSQIFIQFEIDEEGMVRNPKILRGINKELDNQIVEIIGSMPNWIPAYEFSKPVRTSLTYPIRLEIR